MATRATSSGDITPRRIPEIEPLPPMSPREREARGLAARDRAPLATTRPSTNRSTTYADLNQFDHARLVDAIDSGRVQAVDELI